MSNAFTVQDNVHFDHCYASFLNNDESQGRGARNEQSTYNAAEHHGKQTSAPAAVRIPSPLRNTDTSTDGVVRNKRIPKIKTAPEDFLMEEDIHKLLMGNKARDTFTIGEGNKLMKVNKQNKTVTPVQIKSVKGGGFILKGKKLIQTKLSFDNKDQSLSGTELEVSSDSTQRQLIIKKVRRDSGKISASIVESQQLNLHKKAEQGETSALQDGSGRSLESMDLDPTRGESSEVKLQFATSGSKEAEVLLDQLFNKIDTNNDGTMLAKGEPGTADRSLLHELASADIDAGDAKKDAKQNLVEQHTGKIGKRDNSPVIVKICRTGKVKKNGGGQLSEESTSGKSAFSEKTEDPGYTNLAFMQNDRSQGYQFPRVRNSSTTEDEDSDRDEKQGRKQGYENEDDPNKLWCICNKPHNNRFMICCDSCDNWFHGYCVGISKAMGEKMEQNGTEWICPPCKRAKVMKEKEAKKLIARNSLTRKDSTLLKPKSEPGFTAGTNPVDNNIKEIKPPASDTSNPEKKPVNTEAANKQIKPLVKVNCIVCKKVAQPNSIYCSDECIDAYIAESLSIISSDKKEQSNANERIIVCERRTRNLIAGPNAPVVSNIKAWIQQHPTYEIVRPSTLPSSKFYAQSKPIPKLNKSSESANKDTLKQTQDRPAKLSGILKPDPKASPIPDHSSSSSSSTSSKTVIKLQSPSEKLPPGKFPPGSIRSYLIKQPDSNKKETLFSEETADEINKANADARKKPARQIKLIPVQPLPTQSTAVKQKSQHPEQSQKIQTPTSPKKRRLSESVGKTTPKPSPDSTVKSQKSTPKKELKPPPQPKSVSDDDDYDDAEETTLSSSSSTNRVNPVRMNVRKSLQELFATKLKETSEVSLTEEQVSLLAEQVEVELHGLFKDTGMKYKSKYRSLLFNIKDKKNTLFLRIAQKSLTPHDLVRLTPEELASTELAQWREREAKHEIDMIKKTELELLTQAKTFVVKTHKGELEIETDDKVATNPTDITVPEMVPDVIEDYKPPDKVDKSGKKLSYYMKDLKEKYGKSVGEKQSSKDKEKDRDKDKERNRDRESGREKHKKRDHKDKHKKHGRRRSSERDKEKEKEKDHHRSGSSRKHSHKSSKDKHRDKSSDRKSEKKHKSDSDDKLPVVQQEGKEKVAASPSRNEQVIDVVPPAATPPLPKTRSDLDSVDMEPSSTVIISTPPYVTSPETQQPHLWKGYVSMPDVARFKATIKEISGNCIGLQEDFASEIECVGRINPGTVWEYIQKVRKTGNREICVFRFEIDDDEQKVDYLSFYSYLDTKNRMAVVGNSSSNIKDFYMFPLASHSPIPPALLPIDSSFGFEDYKPHLLLGLVVRSRRMKSTQSWGDTSFGRGGKVAESFPPSTPSISQTVLPPGLEEESFTPPHSPTRRLPAENKNIAKKIKMGKRESTSASSHDEDKPYSPGEGEPYSPSTLDEDHLSGSGDNVFQRQMEELNRKIEEEKQLLKNMRSSIDESDDMSEEVYSPTNSIGDGGDEETNDIKLPTNIQQILDSIKKRTDTTSASSGGIFESDPIVSAYKQDTEAPYSPGDKPIIEDDVDENLDDELIATESLSEEKPDDKVILEESMDIDVDEVKPSRDPRQRHTKIQILKAKNLQTPETTQLEEPPPPGTEEEYVPPLPPGTEQHGMVPPAAVYPNMPTDAPMYGPPPMPDAAGCYNMFPYPGPVMPSQMYMPNMPPPVYPQPPPPNMPYTGVPPMPNMPNMPMYTGPMPPMPSMMPSDPGPPGVMSPVKRGFPDDNTTDGGNKKFKPKFNRDGKYNKPSSKGGYGGDKNFYGGPRGSGGGEGWKDKKFPGNKSGSSYSRDRDRDRDRRSRGEWDSEKRGGDFDRSSSRYHKSGSSRRSR